MVDYGKYIYALRKCAKEHESERTLHGQIIVSDLCRDTANLLEELKREPTTEEIRAEIEPKRKMYLEMNDIDWLNGCDYVLSIIDKYKAGSEE